MAWVYLTVAGLFEILWAALLKSSEGLTKPLPAAGFIVALAVSMLLLAISMRQIPLSIAYPIWTGIGALGSFLIGILFFGEVLTLAKAIFALFLLVGVIGLKVAA